EDAVLAVRGPVIAVPADLGAAPRAGRVGRAKIAGPIEPVIFTVGRRSAESLQVLPFRVELDHRWGRFVAVQRRVVFRERVRPLVSPDVAVLVGGDAADGA